jgi:hypothetical protein
MQFFAINKAIKKGLGWRAVKGEGRRKGRKKKIKKVNKIEGGKKRGK